MFHEIFYAYPLLSLVQMAFTVWMLVDAYRRPAEQFWFWVIFLFQPIGPWAYFFMVKLGDFTGSGSSRGWQHPGGGWTLPFVNRRPSIEELRYQAEHVPTLANSLALAERLVEKNEHEEALPHLESALAREPDHCGVLFLFAVCHAELRRPEKAVPELDKVIARDRGWSDYSAWRLLVRARSAMNDNAGALATCRELTRIAPTLRHRVILAELLIAEAQSAEARDLLQRALEDYRFAPSGVRRLNRPYAGQAKKLLKQVPAANVEFLRRSQKSDFFQARVAELADALDLGSGLKNDDTPENPGVFAFFRQVCSVVKKRRKRTKSARERRSLVVMTTALSVSR